jgi:hypothetical protein
MNTKCFSYCTKAGLFGAYTEESNKEGFMPLYVTFTEKPNEFGLLIKNTERKDMTISDTTVLQIDWVRLAWNSGRSYSQLESDQDKADLILGFDEDVKTFEKDEAIVKELQDAFAVGANGLPFSEVKKG